MLSTLLSVNLGRAAASAGTEAPDGLTGIDKRPAAGPVAVSAPGPKGTGGSGLAGDTICHLRHHGGDDQAVYAYAREDLDRWEAALGRKLTNGVFGENLTTSGIDVNGARIGERWRIGPDLVIEATSARTPCRTFATWLDERGWIKRFTREAAPGAYFRVIRPGVIRAGDPIEIVHRPDHEVSVAFLFRAETTEPELRPRVLAAGEALHPQALRKARGWATEAAGTPGSDGADEVRR
ncbi:MOSC domain-containing protein [Streptomyces sp. NBC_01803]|uniref:MOSC domain-containing protein n=1 Tax=Streptomyces sp. NBC_01803 TaxID=2975946 RepID=UPI002DD9ECE4|nr:MOSC domain-containing protein [Streptomyces sp. NBC_01803]WSA44509.1 MOSC domain-containing protein [Streptomyces sp. NBC_01803]